MGPLLQSSSSDVTRLISEAADNGAVRYRCPFQEVKQLDQTDPRAEHVFDGPMAHEDSGREWMFYCHLALHSLKFSETF